MKYALVTFFTLLLISPPGYSAFQTGKEGRTPGRPVTITPLRPKSCPTCERASFTNNSGISKPLRVVIRAARAWRKVWEQIHAPFSPQPPLPKIDFSKEMVVVVAMGARPTGGYGIIVDRAYERAGRLEIIVRTQTAGKNCFTTQAVTEPVDIVRLPKTKRAVVFRETAAVHACK